MKNASDLYIATLNGKRDIIQSVEGGTAVCLVRLGASKISVCIC